MTPAIETKYFGHTFRSRLEARWAALFDLLGWTWTYEPFDGDRYIPDFLIHGDFPVVVEVKPDLVVSDLRRYVPKVDRGLKGVWDRDVLIVGSTPTMPGEYWGDQRAHPAIGLLGERGLFPGGETGRAWDEGTWRTCESCHNTAFVHAVQSYTCRPCGHYDGGSSGLPAPDLASLWGRAHERTRWMP